jgi:hypothetical protein
MYVYICMYVYIYVKTWWCQIEYLQTAGLEVKMWWAMFYYVTLLQLIIYLIIMVMFNSKLSNYQSVLKLAHGVVLQDSRVYPCGKKMFPQPVWVFKPSII